MPRKGETVSEELKAKMAEGRRLSRERKAQEPVMEPDEGPIELKLPAEDLRLDDILSDEEIAEIRREARAKALREQKEARKKAVADEELRKARRSLGETPQDEVHRQDMEEPTRVFVQMPRLRKPTGGEQDPEPIIIDQKIYTSGRWYTVPKGRAIYMRWLMAMAERHVDQVDGRSRARFNPGTYQVEWTAGVPNSAAAGGTLAPSFETIHRRPS